MAKIEKQVLDAATSMSPEAILKLWSPFIPQNPEQFREAFARFFAPPSVLRPAARVRQSRLAKSAARIGSRKRADCPAR